MNEKGKLLAVAALGAAVIAATGFAAAQLWGEGAGMPVGLQLIGNYFQEGGLLHAAHAFQQATDWHRRAPQGAAA